MLTKAATQQISNNAARPITNIAKTSEKAMSQCREEEKTEKFNVKRQSILIIRVEGSLEKDTTTSIN